MKKYKISEIAKLFNISRETLLYYDKIGILSPPFIDENNRYRYYTDESITELSFILNLKDSNFSLKEIKEYLEADQNKKSLSILEYKLEKIDDQIKKLELSRKAILREIEQINLITSLKENDTFIDNQTSINTYLIPVKEPKGEYELQESLVDLKSFRKKNNLMDIKRITILKKEAYLSGNIMCIDKVGYVFLNPTDNKQELITDCLDGGRYACIYHKDETSKLGESYNKLLNYIKDKNLEIIGDSREFFDDLVVNTGERKGRIIKVCIPIK